LQESIVVDLTRCTNCGICTTVCPTGAFEAVSPTLPELCERVATLGQASHRLTFRCQNHTPDEADPTDAIIQLPCLGRVDEALLLEAAAAGIDTIRLEDGGCAQCVRKRGSDVALCGVNEVNRLLAWCGHRTRLRVMAHPSADNPSPSARTAQAGRLSRRAFFAMLWNAAGQAKERIVNPAPPMEGAEDCVLSSPAKKKENGKYFPVKWQRMLQALKTLKSGQAPLQQPCDLWSQVHIGNDCRGCYMCEFFCPTGALSMIEMDGKSGLSITPAHCTGCNLCSEICLKSCININSIKDMNVIFSERHDILILRNIEMTDTLLAPMEHAFYKLLGIQH
jgi:formate hydrogenlyase subunit 6/NADH:ubiquinone oxidoreductase subunit I